MGNIDERDTGPWTMSVWGDEDDRIVIQSDDFHHDVALEVTGDFADIESRKRYAIWLAGLLTKACSERDARAEQTK